LWQCLRSRQLNGFKFRRQQPLAGFVADFFCPECNLVVELDGDSHYEMSATQYDERRTRRIERAGIRVIRFDNTEVFDFLDNVLETILSECECHASHPPSPLEGEGGGEGEASLTQEARERSSDRPNPSP
jgi:ATP-dependent helicase HrpA/adenine-specific DNA-methyltransferase